MLLPYYLATVGTGTAFGLLPGVPRAHRRLAQKEPRYRRRSGLVYLVAVRWAYLVRLDQNVLISVTFKEKRNGEEELLCEMRVVKGGGGGIKGMV